MYPWRGESKGLLHDWKLGQKARDEQGSHFRSFKIFSGRPKAHSNGNHIPKPRFDPSMSLVSLKQMDHRFMSPAAMLAAEPWDLRFTCLVMDSLDWNMLSREPGLQAESQFRELFTSLNSNYNHSTIFTNLVPYAGQLQLGTFMANWAYVYSVVKKNCLNILYKYTLIKTKG